MVRMLRRIEPVETDLSARAPLLRIRRRRSSFSVAALVGLLALACGDSTTDPAPPPPPPPPPNRAPAQSGSIPAQTVHVGETVTVNASSYFTDPDGDALTYTAASSETGVATVTVAGSTLTVTAATQGMATVTVTARDPDGLSAQQNFTVTVPNRAPEALLTADPDTITTEQFLTFSPPVAEWFSDPDDDSLTYAASSSDEGVAVAELVDGELVVRAVAAGTATITVSAVDPGGLSAEVTFDITVIEASQEAVIVTSVEPEVLVEGEAATITGTGFSDNPVDNEVYLGGLAAQVTSATETSLSIVVPEADCLPPRREELQVTVADSSGARTVGVTPVISDDAIWVTNAGDGCVHLPGSEEGGEYLIGVVSISEDVSSLTPVALNGTPGDATVVAAARYAAASRLPPAMLETAASLASQPRRPPMPMAAAAQEWFPTSARRDSIRARHARAQLERRARDLAMLRELGPVIPPAFDAAAAARRRDAAVGDTLMFRVNPETCTEFDTIRAVVRLVSDDLVWLDDVENPQVFSETALNALDGFYSDYVKGVHADYFGELSDVDRNDGRVLVLMTKEVNKEFEENGTLGWIIRADILSQSACAASNEAEVYYALVPDPEGSFGSVVSADFAFEEQYELLAHEIAHLIQNNSRFYGEAGDNTTLWEIEGAAVLAEQLVGYRVFGHGSGQDLGWDEWRASGDKFFYDGWLADMRGFFGRGPDDTKIVGAPEECSWVDQEDAGNTGPCLFRAVYGVPSMVLRYAMDRWGAEYPGGEQVLLRRFIQSPPPHEGFASLVDVSPSSSWSVERILADFYMALGLEVLKGMEHAGMASWDLYDIFHRLPSSYQLQPYTADSASPEIGASIRAGSSLYFDWTPEGSLSPTSIKVTSPDGSPVPDHISVWAIRIP